MIYIVCSRLEHPLALVLFVNQLVHAIGFLITQRTGYIRRHKPQLIAILFNADRTKLFIAEHNYRTPLSCHVILPIVMM
ncbi:hypothetical protein ATO50_00520 [Aeromonas hydrophila]|nr:hypothetical protein ATO50_00520 [Aeromonas hydrophila]